MESNDGEDDWSDSDWLCPIAVTRRVLGAHAATALSEECGGMSVYFPKNPGPNHWLSRLFGHQGALILAKELGGVTLTVSRNASRRARDSLVAQMTLAGETAQAIGRRIGVGDRYVYQIRTRLRREGRLPARLR